MAKFEPELYRRYRIAYPGTVFEPLKAFCQVMAKRRLRVLDLGAGTGLASRSFLEFYPHAEFTWVEPDEAMLNEALQTFEPAYPVTAILDSAEKFECAGPVDLVLIASAWHWMKPAPTLQAILRVLAPGGVIWVCEYQFPKAVGAHSLELNEWVRREFNLRWKPEAQVPRGSLEVLTRPLRDHVEFGQVNSVVCEETQTLGLDHFLGVIFSQSRYLVFERQFSDSEKKEYRSRLRSELFVLWGDLEERNFLYTFRVYVMRRRNF